MGNGVYSEMSKVEVLINGQKKELTWVERQGEWPAHYELNGEPFDGHRVLWSFAYEPYTYLKESELSGDEWRKGGTIKIFRNGEQVYKEFCRDPQNAASRMWGILAKCMDFDWEGLKEGRQIWWRETPAIITRLLLDQGAIIVDAVPGHTFPDRPWDKEDWEKLEDNTSVKLDIFDKNIWWWRE